jgi:hypothetical protein
MSVLDWRYSRNQRRHWVEDGEWYGKPGSGARLFEIKTCAQYRFIQKPGDGYDLFYKGKKIGHGKKVKDLKAKALDWHTTALSMQVKGRIERKKETSQKAVPPS